MKFDDNCNRRFNGFRALACCSCVTYTQRDLRRHTRCPAPAAQRPLDRDSLNWSSFSGRCHARWHEVGRDSQNRPGCRQRWKLSERLTSSAWFRKILRDGSGRTWVGSKQGLFELAGARGSQKLTRVLLPDESAPLPGVLDLKLHSERPTVGRVPALPRVAINVCWPAHTFAKPPPGEMPCPMPAPSCTFRKSHPAALFSCCGKSPPAPAACA